MTKVPSPIVGGSSNNPIKTFAFITLSERLPEVLVKCLDTFHRTYVQFVPELNDNVEEEAKKIIGQFSKLRYELMTDKPLELLSGTAEDIKIWNDVYHQWSAKLGTSPVYFTIPWLYAECYMYRKIGEVFDNSQFFKGFDPFRDQKCRALTNSIPAIISLAEFLANYQVTNNENSLMDDLRNVLEMSLWGNKCDLSLSAGEDVGIGSGLLGKLKEMRQNILINDCDKLLEKLRILKCKSNSTLDIVLDNAGYELFTDLCLVEFLHITKILPIESSRVRFYVKNYPWFVSDAMIYDFHWTLQYLEEATQSDFLKSLGKKMRNYLNQGVWTIENDLFFTLPHDFSQMQAIRPELHEKLSRADLILFKGDLNYRKLVGDLKWPLTASFEEALRGFHPSDLCTLRSIKAEVCVGFKDEKQIKSLPNNWMVSSDYAVVQYLGNKELNNVER